MPVFSDAIRRLSRVSLWYAWSPCEKLKRADAHAGAEKRLELGNVPGHRAESAHDVGAVLDGGDALDARVLAVDACALMWVGMGGGIVSGHASGRRGGAGRAAASGK
jgi:hypothetical protein